MRQKYIVKSLTPWMVDELKAISDLIDFDLILLRTPEPFYQENLDLIAMNGSCVHVKPYSPRNLFRKIWVLVYFFFSNIFRFDFGYNAVLGFKSMLWFFRLDLGLFDETSRIHSQFATQPAIISLLVKNYYRGKPKLSFTFHAYDIYFNNKWFSKLVKESTRAFSISNFNIDYVRKKFINSDKIVLSRLGVFRSAINKKEKSTNEVFVVGLMSWFIEKKGISFLLEAMNRFNNDGPQNIKLKLAGDGPLKEKLIKFVADNDLQYMVEFVGKIKGDEKEAFYNSLDAFILPSVQLKNDQDGIPVVLMEAIAYGLPIISTNVSGIPEICIQDYNGKLIRERNVQDIYDALCSFMNDTRELTTYSKNSEQLSEEYDIETNSKRKLSEMQWI